MTDRILVAATAALALADGVLHLAIVVLFSRRFPSFATSSLGLMFLANFFGYVVLTAAFLFGRRRLGDRAWLANLLLIVYAAGSIGVWVWYGRPNPMGLGYPSKALEALPTVDQVTDDRGKVLIPGPAPAQFLFKHTQMSWFWLIVRVWVGWQWLEASWHKLGNPAWMDGSGTAIRGFWEKALAGTSPGGDPAIAYGWYRSFIQLLVDHHAEGWFSKLIAFGELTVGVALILGALTGVAAAGGLLMSESYMLAGTAATSPI